MMHPVIAYLIAAVLFGLGIFGVLTRRNAVLLLMSVELLLNAVNLVFVTADATAKADATPRADATTNAVLPATGQVFALFVIVLAAAEVGVGLALILALYRRRSSIAVDEIELTEPPGPAAPTGSAVEPATASDEVAA
jgi:NADH-quinone oxidoreductase subunit K